MNMLFFSTYFSPYTSGLVNAPLPILKRLAQKHTVTVLTFRHDANLPSSESMEGIRIIRMPYAFRLSKGFISPQSLIYFWRYARSADTVILNLPNAEGAPLVLFARLNGKKVVTFFNCLVNLGSDITSSLLSALVNMSTFLQIALSSQVIGYKGYVEITTLYRFFSSKIHATLPYVTKRSSDPIYQKKLASHKKNVWIGFVGRLAREKGLEYLIQSLENLPHNLSYTLIFAGPNPEHVVGESTYARAIQQLVNDRKIPHIFLGKLSDSQLGSLYRALDVLVLPSVNSTEAMGLVQIEAMLAGTPVVASDLPGVSTPIHLTGMGIRVKPRDTAALTTALAAIVNNRQDFAQKKQIDRARQLFSSSSLLNFYEDLIAQSS